MTMTATVDLPPQVARLLNDFCSAAKSGVVQLDIKNGRVVSFKVTETGYVDKLKQ